jgi:hypothetical protein
MPDTNSTATNIAGLLGWAEQFGLALGQGVARGINGGLGGLGGAMGHNVVVGGGVGATTVKRGRGRPPKPFFGFVAADKRCKTPGCGKPARSKGLCSAHYQAARRKKMARA